MYRLYTSTPERDCKRNHSDLSNTTTPSPSLNRDIKRPKSTIFCESDTGSPPSVIPNMSSDQTSTSNPQFFASQSPFQTQLQQQLMMNALSSQAGIPHQLIQPQGTMGSSISDTDIDRIAKAVRSLLLEDIHASVQNQIAPLVSRVESLESENDKLRLQLDDLEQYGRRSLVRFSGFPEKERENTTDTVLQATAACGINLDPAEVERSHRVGKPSPTLSKPRQIIMRLRSVDTKFLLLKSAKNFRKNENFKHISVNEDLTKFRGQLAFFSRQLVKNGRATQTWTTNGKILIRDRKDRVHLIKTEQDLVEFGHVIVT